MDTRAVMLADLRQAILAARNSDGGWAYHPGHASRLEPTCWAMLALGADADPPDGAFLTRCQQPSGWLVEDAAWPVNIAFNALAAFTWLHHPGLATDDRRARLLAVLSGAKGVQAPPLAGSDQDNRLQGWPWIAGTFSWVEPTAWGVLALRRAKAAAAGGAAAVDVEARLSEAAKLLLNRACHAGGWNFGNADVMGQDLRPYVQASAMALLALTDRRSEPAVVRGLAFLREHWRDEPSALAWGLSLLCLDVYGARDEDIRALDAGVRERAAGALAAGNWHGAAIARFALAARGRANAFSL